MNIQQFQYVLAVAQIKHFEKAAEKCFVTQSTLSTMIGRMEDELGIKIFNRKTKPVSITQEGEKIINQLQIILREIDSLQYIAQALKGEMVGEIKIGIIPTVSPYLCPMFLTEFVETFPKVQVVVQEMTTSEIQRSLHQRTVDIGIVALPLLDEDLIELSLYEEPFVIYDCKAKKRKSDTVDINEIDFSRLWLLQEGHCLRHQVEQICNLSQNKPNDLHNLEFKAGSLDSLIRFTKAQSGVTLLPYFATLNLPQREQQCLLKIGNPIPARSVGLLVHKHFVKHQILKKLQEIIKASITPLQTAKAEGQRLIRPV